MRHLLIFVLLSTSSAFAVGDEFTDAITTIQKIKLHGAGNVAAIKAVRTLSSAPADQLPNILVAMTKGNDIPNNWLRAAAESVADRARKSKTSLPYADLQKVLDDSSNPPRGRELAFVWLVESKGAEFRSRMLNGMRNDPSLELRRQAIARGVDQFEKKNLAGSEAIAELRGLLRSARDVGQIEDLTKRLEERNETVDLPLLFGFVTDWHLVAPFDNTNKSGFDKIYPPERSVDLTESYNGKAGKKVAWVVHSTDDQFGMVNLKGVFGKNKGSVAYAFVEFNAVEARPADLRLGCINANKIWLNGKMMTANHVYHSGTAIDQYTAQGQLRKGRNEILLKICENEQEENWAQDWQFQFRVCDELGTALLSKDRLDAQSQ
ncbi:hypothetical protein ACFL2H_06555 [Planctomycetota bacterium]